MESFHIAVENDTGPLQKQQQQQQKKTAYQFHKQLLSYHQT